MLKTLAPLIALAPLLIIGTTTVVVMAGVAWRRHHFLSATLTSIGLNAALLSLLMVVTVTPIQVTPLFIIDNYAVLYCVMILISALACASLAYAYLESFPDRREEFYILLLCSTAGAITLVCSRHFAGFFIGLELLSVPLFGMIAYAFRDRISLEAGIKYMVLSAAASAFLLFGIALVYAVSGSLVYSDLTSVLGSAGTHNSWLLIGVGMMLVTFAFKLSLAPLHLWTPDVYEGAPSPVSAFLATVSKLAVFAVLVRLFQAAPIIDSGTMQVAIAAIAFTSILVGNLLALRQNNIKRLIGYSSIAHLGYLLTAIAANNSLTVETAGVYLATYVLTTLGAFGVVTLVSGPYAGTDADALHHYRGLFWRRPYLASVLTVMMMSFAGIPVTAGFIGKFYAIAVTIQAQMWWLAVTIVVGSAIGLYYYLRVIIILYMREPGHATRDAVHGWGLRSGGVMVLLLSAAVIALGVYPQPLISLVRWATLATG